MQNQSDCHVYFFHNFMDILYLYSFLCFIFTFFLGRTGTYSTRRLKEDAKHFCSFLTSLYSFCAIRPCRQGSVLIMPKSTGLCVSPPPCLFVCLSASLPRLCRQRSCSLSRIQHLLALSLFLCKCGVCVKICVVSVVPAVPIVCTGI